MSVQANSVVTGRLVDASPGAASSIRSIVESWIPRLSEAALPAGAAIWSTVRREAMKRKGPVRLVAKGAIRAVVRRPLLFGAAGLGAAVLAGVGIALYQRRKRESLLPEPLSPEEQYSDAASSATTVLQ